MDDFFKVVRPWFLALAFSGAVMALSFWPPADRKTAAINILVGTTISSVTVPAVTVLISWNWPTFPNSPFLIGPIYFWVGLMGMQLVPVIAFVIGRLKKIKLPGVE